MSYKPLSEVKKTLRVDWYRSPIDPKKLRELSTRSDAQGWFQTAGHLGLFVLAGALAILFWSLQSWVLFALALFAQGTVASFYAGTAPHELGHGSVFKTKRLNKIFLYLTSFIGWWDPFDYASSHTFHHRYTLHPEGDRENLLPLKPTVGRTFLLQLFTINLLTQPGRTFGKGGLISTLVVTFQSAFGRVGTTEIPSNEWLEALHEDQPDEHRKSIRWSRFLLVGHGLILVAGIASGFWVVPLVVSLPVFVANWSSYFVGMTQHCGLRDNSPDFRKNTRSLKLNPFYAFLYWHMNWHIEHHMFAGVPWYNLKRLYQEIAHDMPEPRTLRQAWQEMIETWNRQQSDPDFQYDTPLPQTARTAREGEGPPRELEASIGDLAPEGLR
ncbi:MAG: fatty acid desaturase [Trueperaceae bacterium]|nr:MAG: fatty acid desaturase [Trueperaceae bacterium]